MRLSLQEPRYLKDAILILSELVTDVNIRFDKDKMEIIATDPASVALVDFKLLSSAFSEYYLDGEKVISLNLSHFTKILKRVKPSDILELSLDEEKNQLEIVVKGMTTRRFHLSLLSVDASEQRIPQLSFASKIETNNLIFNEAIEDMDIVADSLTLEVDGSHFSIYSSGTTSKGHIMISSDDETSILSELPGLVKARFSVEYLKKIIKGSKLSHSVILQLGNKSNLSDDYPLRAEYRVLDKLSLSFILAPRVST